MRRSAVWILAIAAIAIFLVIGSLDGSLGPLEWAAYLGVIASFSLVGALLITRVPGNPIAMMLLAAGLLLDAGVVLGTYATLGAHADPTWPGAALAAVVTDVVYIYPIVIALIGVPLVFPDGHLPSGRFRWLVWLTMAAMIATTLDTLLTPGTVGVDELQNPLGNAALEPVLSTFGAFSSVTSIFGFGGAAAAVLVRFRGPDPVVRQQTKWLVAVASVAAIAFPLAFIVPNQDLANGSFVIGFLALLGLPVAIAVAILRYRLYEIDRLISRTIAYAIVVALLAAVFVGAILLATAVLSSFTNGQTVAVAASTLVVFALFQPVLRRVRRAVDRRFDRARYDAERIAAAFSDRLRGEVDMETVTGDLTRTAALALAPARSGIWIRSREIGH